MTDGTLYVLRFDLEFPYREVGVILQELFRCPSGCISVLRLRDLVKQQIYRLSGTEADEHGAGSSGEQGEEVWFWHSLMWLIQHELVNIEGNSSVSPLVGWSEVAEWLGSQATAWQAQISCTQTSFQFKFSALSSIQACLLEGLLYPEQGELAPPIAVEDCAACLQRRFSFSEAEALGHAYLAAKHLRQRGLVEWELHEGFPWLEIAKGAPLLLPGIYSLELDPHTSPERVV
jgi:hypothetical protein